MRIPWREDVDEHVTTGLNEVEVEAGRLIHGYLDCPSGTYVVRVLKRNGFVVLNEPEKFYAIRRTDGELIMGEYEWAHADGPDDWVWADESDHDDPTEYEIVEMTVRSISKRTFGEPFIDDEDET